MKQEPISCRADNALAARCQSFAARWACVLKRPIFYLAAYIDNNSVLYLTLTFQSVQLFWRLFRIYMTTKQRNINCSALPKILLNQKNISGKNAPNNLYDPLKYPKKWQEHLLQVHPLPPPRLPPPPHGWQI